MKLRLSTGWGPYLFFICLLSHLAVAGTVCPAALVGSLQSRTDEKVIYASELRANDPGYLGDHQVFYDGQLQVLVPGAALLSMALEAVRRQSPGATYYQADQFKISRAFILPADGRSALLTNTVVDLTARTVTVTQPTDPVQRKFPALTGFVAQNSALPDFMRREETEPLDKLARPYDLTNFYGRLAPELTYGPTFQNLKKAWLQENGATGLVALPIGLTLSHEMYHAAALDSCLHLGGPLVDSLLDASDLTKRPVYIPTKFTGITFNPAALSDRREFWCQLEVINAPGDRGFSYRLSFRNSEKVPILNIDEVMLLNVSR